MTVTDDTAVSTKLHESYTSILNDGTVKLTAMLLAMLGTEFPVNVPPKDMLAVRTVTLFDASKALSLSRFSTMMFPKVAPAAIDTV